MINPEAFFKISYGLYLVSSANGTRRSGYISNTVFQVTAEPPQFAIACSKNNYTSEIISAAGKFAVSVLKMDAGASLIGTFGYRSGRESDKFAGMVLKTGVTGAPIVMNDALAIMECTVVQTIDLGTHLLYIAKVEAAELIDPGAEPLTYAHYRSVRKGKAPKNAPTYIDPEKLEARLKQPRYPSYYCPACGYVYVPANGDEASGIPPGTRFEDLPDDWVCPVCGTPKEDFVIKTI